jgi:hypothetical protein
VTIRKNLSGTTVLEMIFVLAVAGTFTALGIKLYQSFDTSLKLQGVKDNVNQLFEAAYRYYSANCEHGSFSPNPPNFLTPYTTSGSQTYPPSATTYLPVSIPSILTSVGYLADWYPANPTVDPTYGDAGYIVQLNPVTSMQRAVIGCPVIIKGTACLQASPTTNPDTVVSPKITVVSWQLQVAVKLKNTQKATAEALALGADCLSGSTATAYAVWVRTPSAAIPKSKLAPSLAFLKSFARQYTHDQYYEYNFNSTNTSITPIYYLCGG